MTEGILTPKFLTKQVAAIAVEQVLSITVLSRAPIAEYLNLTELFKRHVCHIVILVPSMVDDRESDYPEWPDYDVIPHLLYEHSIGDKSGWEYPFDNIARCKALQLWHGRNDDRTDCMPHLLFPGDTPFWGGVKRHGIVVTCSGVQPWFDKMTSGMIADMCIGLAYNQWMTGFDRNDDRNFLS